MTPGSLDASLGVTLRVSPWTAWRDVAPDWEHVYRASGIRSFFLSPEWVSCWVDTFGPAVAPELVTVLRGSEPIGCCLLVWRLQWVKGVPLRRVFLNCAGEDEQDTTWIEYNALLHVAGGCGDVVTALLGHLQTRGWDEFHLPGCLDDEAVSRLVSAFAEAEVMVRPTRHVSFDALRSKRQDYLASLSAKNRYHIRRTERQFEELGGRCQVDIAGTVDRSLAFLDEMARLHGERWTQRGDAGRFSSERFSRFHRRFIERHHDRVLLLRLRAGEQTVGVIYCILDHGWVHHYQSGFNYGLDRRRSPGLLTICHAISACLSRSDIAGFDFMSGDTEYKRALTSHGVSGALRWHVLRRSTVRNRIFLGLREVKRACQRGGSADEAMRALRDSGVITTLVYEADQPAPGTDVRPAAEVVWRALGPEHMSELSGIGPFDPELAPERFARGDRCYGAYVGDRLAHYVWVQHAGVHPIHPAGLEAALEPGDRWIFHARTADWARGLRIYPATLARVIAAERAAGAARIRVYTTHDNHASQRGILRAGFRERERIRAIRLGRVCRPLRMPASFDASVAR